MRLFLDLLGNNGNMKCVCSKTQVNIVIWPIYFFN